MTKPTLEERIRILEEKEKLREKAECQFCNPVIKPNIGCFQSAGFGSCDIHNTTWEEHNGKIIRGVLND